LTYNNIILPKYKNNVPSVLEPRFVIICAQPGAGKSGLPSRLRNAFKEAAQHAVHVDVDNMRRFHARLDEIIAEDPIRMGEHTNEAVNIWKGFLLGDARRDNNNVVHEITLRTADVAKSEIDKYQKQGYAVELHTMAVHQHLSRLGVFQRFEGAIKSDRELPRYIPMAFHDVAYHALPRNVDDIERNFALSLVTVNTRGGDVVYSRSGQNGEPEAMQAILLERNRSWSAQDKAAHVADWAKVVKDVLARPNDKLKDAGYLKDLHEVLLAAVGQPFVQVPPHAKEQDVERIIRRVIVRAMGM
jgi:hypothetical protein